MVSFCQLWEKLEENSSPLMDSGEEPKAAQIVRAGLNLREKDETSFWDDFKNLCANADGLSELLEVDSSKISTWPAKIQKVIEGIEKHNQEETPEDENSKVIPTGDNGAITANNIDPNLGEM